MADRDPMAKCGARTRRGTPCDRDAGWGTDHLGVGRCKFHGGASPQAQAAGVVELARREAAIMGQPLDVDPHDALLQCVKIAAGEVRYASDQVAALRRATVSTMFGPQLDMWITVRQQAMDRLVGYSKVAIAAGVAERQVRLAEALGGALAATIGAILDDLGLRNDPRAPQVVRKHLALLEGGASTTTLEAA